MRVPTSTRSTTSWRNPTRVLAAANVLVEPLSAASPVPVERLRPRPAARDGRLDVAFEQTVADEAETVAAWLADRLSARDDQGRMPSAALLCRSLKKIDVFTEALARRGVPYHVLGLGGLLEQPVIADLVSAMRVMHDPTAGSELIRVLTGARWRIGAKDIAALRRVASWLAARDHRFRELDPSVRDRLRHSVAGDESASLVDALDFVVEAPESHSQLSAFSAAGAGPDAAAGRLSSTSCGRGSGSTCSTSSRSCSRSCCSTSRSPPTSTRSSAQASLDAFAEQVASYLASDEQATLGSFLSWLAEAEQRDNLAPRSENPEPGTVQILTIHGSKGLEWDIVAVPRMVDGELPGAPRSKKGWLEFGALPYEFRGDATELPVLAWRTAETQKDVDAAARGLRGGDRRSSCRRATPAGLRGGDPRAGAPAADRFVLVDADEAARPRGRSFSNFRRAGLLHATMRSRDSMSRTRIRYALAAETVSWPLDPLGSRRDRVASGSRGGTRVPRARRRAGTAASTPTTSTCCSPSARTGRPRRARRAADAHPGLALQGLRHRPAAVAAALRRPMPERPYRQTRLGTLFHGWVEQRYGTARGRRRT